MVWFVVYHYLWFVMQEEHMLTPPPIQLPKFTERAEFGKEIKRKHFFLDVNICSNSKPRIYCHESIHNGNNLVILYITKLFPLQILS